MKDGSTIDQDQVDLPLKIKPNIRRIGTLRVKTFRGDLPDRFWIEDAEVGLRADGELTRIPPEDCRCIDRQTLNRLSHADLRFRCPLQRQWQQ